MKTYRALLAAALITVAACGPSPEGANCKLEGKNYLSDADFALEAESSRSKHWTGIQHAGEKSYLVTISDGVASIEKVGTQPWFLLRQRIDATELAGRSVVFTAQMRLLHRSSESRDVTELQVGLKLFAQASGRSRLQVHQYLDPGLAPEEWQTLRMVVELPAQTEFLKLNLYREAEGLVQARYPSLQLIDKRSGSCVEVSTN